MKFKLSPTMLNRHVNVTVAGCGGTGSYLLPMLAQINYLLRALSGDMCGLNVTAYDPNCVRITNVGRANFWPVDVDRPKSEVLIERLNMGFGTQWTHKHANVERCHATSCDFLMTCTDTVSSRMAIGQAHKEDDNEIVWIDGGNGESDMNVCVGHLGYPRNTLKIPNWFDLYAPTMQNVKDDTRKSCSHEDSITRQDWGVNQQCAMLMARVLWRFLRHGATAHGLHYCDINAEQLDSLQIDPAVWATFDYQGEGAVH